MGVVLHQITWNEKRARCKLNEKIRKERRKMRHKTSDVLYSAYGYEVISDMRFCGNAGINLQFDTRLLPKR